MRYLRYVLPVLGVLVVVGGLAFIKASQIKMLIGFGAAAEKAGPPPEVVSSAAATLQTWEDTLPSVGTVAPVKGVTISNDAPGVVSAITFESGAKVTQGQVLVVLDNSVERAQLASAQARRELASLNVGRTRTLVQSDSLPKAQLDNDEAVVKTSGADLNALQAQIDRKVVRAPFSGHLGIRLVNVGQYLNPGTPIAVLDALESVYVDFSLPQQNLADVVVGTPVRVSLDGGANVLGSIAAVDPSIDSQTRSIKLRAGIPNEKELLRPGMFVKVSVVKPQKKSVVTVPATAVVHASYGDSVFVVENKPDAPGVKVARQQFVRTGEMRGDFVSIQDGVKGGDEVVVAGAFKLRNGAGIKVDNASLPDFQLAPKPENR